MFYSEGLGLICEEGEDLLALLQPLALAHFNEPHEMGGRNRSAATFSTSSAVEPEGLPNRRMVLKLQGGRRGEMDWRDRW